MKAEEGAWKMLCCGKTDIGRRREKNEDACLLRPDLEVVAVADGVGGAAAGEIASRIFVDTAEELFGQSYPRSPDETYALVQQAFRIGNERILGHVTGHPKDKGLGSTAVLIAFCGSRFTVGHMGDSRVYLFREGTLRQLTKDHSLVQDQVDRGVITREQARTHRLRNVVLRALGSEVSVAVDVITGTAQPDDLFLLCSDGLTSMLDDGEIEETLAQSEDIAHCVEKLIRTANAAGGYDNITVVLCKLVPS